MKKNKDLFKTIILIVIMVLCFVFIFLEKYEYITLTKADLSYAKVTFDYFKEAPNSKNTSRNIIYSIEGDTFGFETIINVDKELLKKIPKGADIEIYYRKSKNDYYDFEIIELYFNNNPIITLSDYHEDYTKNLKMSILIISGYTVFFIMLIVFLAKIIKRVPDKKLQINNDQLLKIKKAIKYRGGKFFINMEEVYEDGKVELLLLYKYFYDDMMNQEFRLIFDEIAYDEIVYVIFKYDNKLMWLIGFIDREGRIIIDDELVFWEFPSFSQFTDDEKKFLRQVIDNYSLMNHVHIIYDEEKKNNKKRFKRKKQ